MGGEYQRHHQAASQSAENSRRKANRGERGGCVIRSVIEEWSRKVADAAERITTFAWNFIKYRGPPLIHLALPLGMVPMAPDTALSVFSLQWGP